MRFVLLLLSVVLLAPAAELSRALVFHAAFEHSADADYARGDRRIFTAEDRGKRDTAAPGLPAPEFVRVVAGAGRFGGALEFRASTKQQVFYRGGANLGLAGAPRGWGGTLSFWLKLDPERDLAPGYCDPIQLVAPKWADGAIFVEFTKDHTPRHFRYGIFPVTSFWNPQNKKLEEMTDAERPMVPVRRPIFSRERWTHILITFAQLNSGESDGRGTLFVDGERIGASAGWNHTLNWTEPERTALVLGLNYTGLIDDLAVFDRELTADEARLVFKLPRGVIELHPPKS
ncbi:MAG: LamG-like jellyroll fold domain-containing protein [Opitutaceae bacterium]|nr:LamG-like jellyroll fold domain-containing protein [Opitutaceae bacterium]